MGGISNDYNMRYISNLDSLINPISDSKKFSLYCHNINSVMNSFSSKVQVWVDMWNWRSNIVLILVSVIITMDLGSKRVFFFKFLKINFFTFFILVVCWMKIKTIRKIVNYSKARQKIFMKRIKKRKNFIKTIVGIYNRAFDFELLLGSYLF